VLDAANDEAKKSVDADDKIDAPIDCKALLEGANDDAAADGEAPVLKGTSFCRYRRRPSMSSPAE